MYRAFFEPGVEIWPDGGRSGCAMFIDNMGHVAHVNERNTTFVLVSPAPIDAIDRYKSRMGWDIPWFTTVDDFSADFGVDEYFGLNVFILADNRTYRTCFTNGRAVDAIGNVWSLLDITPLGRQEEWESSPDGYPQDPPYTRWSCTTNTRESTRPQRRRHGSCRPVGRLRTRGQLAEDVGRW